MCSACRMDPAWEKIELQRQGAVEVSDFDDEIPYRKARRNKNGGRRGYSGNKKGQRNPKNRGCPENNHKAHLYVWTSETEREDLFFRFFGYHKYIREVCCGCGKRRKRVVTDRYEKMRKRIYRKVHGDEFSVVRGQGPVSRRFRYRYRAAYSMFSWESYNEEFEAYRKAYIAKYGYNEVVLGNRYDWM